MAAGFCSMLGVLSSVLCPVSELLEGLQEVTFETRFFFHCADKVYLLD